MARERTEFVQSQWLDWEESALLPHIPKVRYKVLSRDVATGEMTALIHYPPGWIVRDAPAASFNEEFLVLDGALEVNGAVYPPYYYSYFPSGMPRPLSATRFGATTLTFFTNEKAPPDAFNPSYPDFAQGAMVHRTDAYVEVWPETPKDWSAFDSKVMRPRMKLLRQDPSNGAETFLIGFVSFWLASTVEVQTVDTEYYLLGGECSLSEKGVMMPGAYLWLEAGAKRVPMGSRSSAAFLVRSHGGRFGVRSQGQGEVQ